MGYQALTKTEVEAIRGAYVAGTTTAASLKPGCLFLGAWGEAEKVGYVAEANCGKDYKPGNRDNMFRYLVGQGLSGLKDGPAIHSIIHKFADEWRREFGITPETAG